MSKKMELNSDDLFLIVQLIELATGNGHLKHKVRKLLELTCNSESYLHDELISKIKDLRPKN